MSEYIIENKHFESVNVADIFSNKLDITWAVGMNNSQKILTKLPIENIIDGIDDGSITYNYNNEWYRCDDFTDKHKKFHVLFSGCSQTEGVGSDIDTIWSRMAYEKLNKKYDIGGFYSLARSGNGWQKIITNFITYTKKYGFPTHFFVLMPNIGRKYDWESDGWKYIQKYPYEPSKGSERDKHTLTIDEHRVLFLDFIISWKLFEDFCKINGTKVLWATWDFNENKNYTNSKQFDNFFSITEEDLTNYIISVRPENKLQRWDLNRRDGHSGILFHELWEKKFIEEIEKRGMFND